MAEVIKAGLRTILPQFAKHAGRIRGEHERSGVDHHGLARAVNEPEGMRELGFVTFHHELSSVRFAAGRREHLVEVDQVRGGRPAALR